MICTILSRDRSVQFPEGRLLFALPWKLVATESVKIRKAALLLNKKPSSV